MKNEQKTAKSFFRYQASEWDCYPITVINALCYLFKPKKIPMDVIKKIYCLTLDSPKDGTTVGGAKHLIKVIEGNLPIKTEYMAKDFDFDWGNVERLNKKEVVALCDIYDMEEQGHSVLAIECDSQWVKIWDPYPWTSTSKKTIENTKEVKLIDQSKHLFRQANMHITRRRFNEDDKVAFSLGKKKEREFMFMWGK